jgi:endogenous inhibitor of DNA gyrase (YacG/DUF329 family)
MKHIAVKCPTCNLEFNYYSSDFRPFCSERCRLIDLGQWLNESYSVPVTKLTEEELQQLEESIENEEE